jgi:hypothetical protein
LLWCDLMQTEPRLLTKYMGDAANDYRERHTSTNGVRQAAPKLVG